MIPVSVSLSLAQSSSASCLPRHHPLRCCNRIRAEDGGFKPINSQVTTSEMRSLGSSTQVSDDSSITLELATADWSYAIEPVGITKENTLTKQGMMEQINTTANASDFLWYSTSIIVKRDEPYLNGSQSNLLVNSLGHVLQVYINGKLAGSAKGNASSSRISLQTPVTLVPGKNKIDLLSTTVGLSNYGAFFDLVGTGIIGPVKLSGPNGALNLSSTDWTYQRPLQNGFQTMLTRPTNH